MGSKTAGVANRAAVSALALIILLTVAGSSNASPAQPEQAAVAVSPADSLAYVPAQILVRFREGVGPSRRLQLGAEAGLDKTLARLGPRGKKDIYLFRLEAGTPLESALAKLRRSKDVSAAEPNYLRHTQVIPAPNDPFYAKQWGLFNNGQVIEGVAGRVAADIRAEVAWASSERAASNPVTLAVIDSGIDANHPDLQSSLWRNSGEVAGNGLDDDANGYVDDINGFNMTGISQTYFNAIWTVGRSDTNWRGQSIWGTGRPLTEVGLWLARVGTPPGNIEIVIRDDLNGPNLATATIPRNDVGETAGLVTAVLSSPVTLAGKTYYILFRPTAAETSNFYQFYGNSSSQTQYRSDPYRGGMQHWWNGTAWTVDTDDDWYFTTNANANPQDDNGHGTHVSGIVGAKIDNSIGIAGVSYGARLMTVKAGDSSGSLTSADIIEALHYAADNGAKVINMSFGGQFFSSLEETAIIYAYGKGAALFAAVGNDGNSTFNFPASYVHVIGVGATTNLDTKASFSNTNTSVDVSAPGEHVYSTMPTYPVGLTSQGVAQDYAFLSGTSMASPMAAGLAALVLSRNPDYTAQQVSQVIQTKLIDDKWPGGWDSSFGQGRLTGINLANEVLPENNRIDGMVWLPASAYSEGLDSAGDRNDIFSVYVGPGERIKVSLTAPSSSDFDLYLYSPGTTDAALGAGSVSPVASSAGTAYPENLAFVASAGAGGTHYLRVNAKSGRGTYTVTYSVMNADNEIPGVAIPSSPISDSLGSWLDEDDVFSVELAAGEQLMASLTGALATDFDLYLYPPASSSFSSAAAASSLTNGYPEKIKYVVPAAAGGTYYLRVAMVGGSSNGSYTLTYSTGPADVTPPVTTLSTSPAAPDGDNGWYRTAPTISLASNEAGATYSQWNATVTAWWDTYTGPFLAYEGNNVLYYYSVDQSENQEAVQAASMKLDRSLPADPALSSSSHGVGAASNDSTVDVQVSGAFDSISGVDGFSVLWTANPGDLPDMSKDLEETVTLITSPSLTDGHWYAHLRTKDNAGNWTAGVHLGPFVIDVTPPVTKLTITPPSPDGDNGWFTSIPTLTLAQENEVGSAYYRWDSTLGPGWIAYSGPVAAAEGVHTFHYYSEDALGNREAVGAQIVKSDWGPPSPPLLKASGDSSTTATLTWNASTDAVSGVAAYRIYDGDFGQLLGSTSAFSYQLSGLVPGVQHRYYVKAVDYAGHESASSNLAAVATLATGASQTVSVESVTLLFSSVVTEGGVSVSTSTTPPATQTGFQLNGVYYDISSTAGYSGSVTITLPYDPVAVTDPQNLRLYHYDKNLGSWIDVTTVVDTSNHTVSGRVTSFSWFAAGQPGRVFGGFELPLNQNRSSSFKLGQVLPVKFKLTDSSGNPVTNAIARIYLAKVTEEVLGSERPGTSTSPKIENVFRYSKTEDQYVFNLETKSLSKGRWQIRVLLDDGISHTTEVTLF